MLRIWSCFECNPHCWVQSVDWPFKFKVYNAAQRIQPTHTVNFTRLQCRLCERAFLIMIHRPDRIPAHGARCAHQAPSMNHYPNDSPYVWRFKKNINKFNTAFSTATVRNSPALGCKLSILANRFRIQNLDRWFNSKISSRKLLDKQSGIETLEYAFERWLMATFRAKLIENIFDDIFLELFSSFQLGSSKNTARATGNPSKTLKETETRSFVYLVSCNSSMVTENVLRKFNPAECSFSFV